MTGERQIPLDLGQRKAMGREDFLLSPSNSAAVAWMDRWPDWPGNGLAVYGPPGCGKTHLAHVWQARSGARFIDASTLAAQGPERLAGAGALVIEEAEEGWPEDRLLHLFNLQRARGGSVLITGHNAPAHWPLRLADLRSRLAALTAVGVGAPDDTLLAAVLVKHFADRQVTVSPGVVAYVAARIERSFAAARRAAAALDDTALAHGRAPTIPLARRVLAELPQADTDAPKS